jgi:hypothetical protein
MSTRRLALGPAEFALAGAWLRRAPDVTAASIE